MAVVETVVSFCVTGSLSGAAFDSEGAVCSEVVSVVRSDEAFFVVLAVVALVFLAVELVPSPLGVWKL